jgi:uncharacterized protein YdcH (DUF465 family)
MPVHPGIREALMASNPEFQRLVAQHSQYEAQLEALGHETYLNAEDLILQIELKKQKLRVKDEIEQLVAQHQRQLAHQ